MKKLSRQEKHAQCLREIRASLLLVGICCLWHVITAFALNGTGFYFLGMPAWFSVSTFGTILIAVVGAILLLKKIFIDFEYDEEEVQEDISLSMSDDCSLTSETAASAGAGCQGNMACCGGKEVD